MLLMSRTFEDLQVRKTAKSLTVEIYRLWKDSKDWWFKDQIQRASLSIMNNIAEGYERSTELDKRRFIVIAKWSCAEVRSMLHIWLDLWYVSKKEYENLLELNRSTWRMLYGLIKKLTP